MSSCSFKDYFRPVWESGTSRVALEVALCRLPTSKTARKVDYSKLHTRLILPGFLFSGCCCNAEIFFPNKPQTAVIWVDLTFLTAYSKDQVEQVDTSSCKSKEFGNQVVISAWKEPFMEERGAEQNLLQPHDSALKIKAVPILQHVEVGTNPTPSQVHFFTWPAQGAVIKGINHYRKWEASPRLSMHCFPCQVEQDWQLMAG